MQYRDLGTTDISVSVLALGCWAFGGGPYWGDRDENESIRTIQSAFDVGINFFDTAEGYADGYSETLLGRALVGRRNQAVIATKVSPSHLAADDLLSACHASLKRLQTDRIDLYQIHWPSRTVPLEESMRALEGLVSRGMVRAIGVSNFGVGDLGDVLEIGPVATDQLPYSLLWRAIEHEIQPVCVANGVGILCYSPLAQGLLSGQYCSVEEVPEGRACTRFYSGERPGTRHGGPGCEEETFAAVAAIKEIADEMAEPMGNLAIAWLLAQPGVTSVLAGARNPMQLRMNAQATELELAPAVIGRLSTATEVLKERLGPNPDMWQTESRYR